jgi:hypothetical protein
MFRTVEERKTMQGVNASQLRSSEPEGRSDWDEEMPFRLERNSVDSLADSYPKHPRVTQPKSRSMKKNMVRAFYYKKVRVPNNK